MAISLGEQQVIVSRTKKKKNTSFIKQEQNMDCDNPHSS